MVPPWEWDLRDLKPAREEESGGGKEKAVLRTRSPLARRWGVGRIHRKTSTQRAKEEESRCSGERGPCSQAAVCLLQLESCGGPRRAALSAE